MYLTPSSEANVVFQLASPASVLAGTENNTPWKTCRSKSRVSGNCVRSQNGWEREWGLSLVTHSVVVHLLDDGSAPKQDVEDGILCAERYCPREGDELRGMSE